MSAGTTVDRPKLKAQPVAAPIARLISAPKTGAVKGFLGDLAGRVRRLIGLAAGVVADGGDEDRVTAIGNLRRTRETTITHALSRRGDGSNGAASIESIVAYQARETPRLSRIL